MNKKVLVLLFLFAASRLYAGDNDSIVYPQLNVTYLKSYYYDTKSFIVSPARWKVRQWIGFGAVAGAGLLAYTQDERIQKYFVSHQSATGDKLATYVFEPFGNGTYNTVLIAGLYLGGRVAKDKRLAGTSLTAAKSYVVSSVFTTALKQLTHRHRPYQDAVPDHANWEGPIAGIHYNSFSSGHSSAAFSLATVFAMEYSRTIWVPVLAYTLATGTAVSRLYDNKHWASDVVIGSAIGFVTGRFMWKQSRNGNSRLNILPSMGTQSGSVTFLYRIG